MTNNSTDEKPPEDLGLKGLLYGLMDLEDRLRDERLVVKTQSAKLDELIKLFTAQVQDFRKIVPAVQREMLDTLATGTKASAQSVGETLSKAATEQVEKSAKALEKSVEQVAHALYASEVKRENFFNYYVLGVVVLVLFTDFMVAKWVVPMPYLALTGKQLNTFEKGETLEKIWPQLSDGEQQQLQKLANGLETNLSK